MWRVRHSYVVCALRLDFQNKSSTVKFATINSIQCQVVAQMLLTLSNCCSLFKFCQPYLVSGRQNKYLVRVRSLNTEVCRKHTDTDQYLLFDSRHPPEHKLGVIKTPNQQAETVPTKTEGKEKENKHIRGALKTCGYPNWTFLENLYKIRQQCKHQPPTIQCWVLSPGSLTTNHTWAHLTPTTHVKTLKAHVCPQLLCKETHTPGLNTCNSPPDNQSRRSFSDER